MKKMKLGFTGAEVSALCLGAMYFGSKTDESTSRALLDQYVEAGGRFIDTANAYARWVPGCRGGESEEVLGRWLKDRGNRGELFIASKVGFPSPIDSLDYGLRAKQIERACEGSLRRLGVEAIDLYYAHADDRSTPLEESLEAFHRLSKGGKVRYLGASNFSDWRLEEARWIAMGRGVTQFCCAQQRFSYVRPQAGSIYDPHVYVNEEVLDYVRNRGLTLLAYSPLLGGAYTRTDRSFPEQYLGPDTDGRLEALAEVAAAAGKTKNQVVLAWMVTSDPPVIPIIAASSREQLAELIGSLDVALDVAMLERLSKAGNRPAAHPQAQRRLAPGAKQG